MTLTTDAVLNRFKRTSINVPEVEAENFPISKVMGNDAFMRALIDAIVHEIKTNATVSFNQNQISRITSPEGTCSGTLSGGKIR